MQDRNLTEGLEISSALSSGSYRKVKYKRMRVSRSGMLIVHNLLWDTLITPWEYVICVYRFWECNRLHQCTELWKNLV